MAELTPPPGNEPQQTQPPPTQAPQVETPVQQPAVTRPAPGPNIPESVASPAAAPPPLAVRVIEGKNEREIALERERDEAVAKQRKAELDAAGLLDENRRLKNPAKPKADRSFLQKFLDGEGED